MPKALKTKLPAATPIRDVLGTAYGTDSRRTFESRILSRKSPHTDELRISSGPVIADNRHGPDLGMMAAELALLQGLDERIELPMRHIRNTNAQRLIPQRFLDGFEDYRNWLRAAIAERQKP